MWAIECQLTEFLKMSKFSKPWYLVVWSSFGSWNETQCRTCVPGTVPSQLGINSMPKELHTTRQHGFENLLIFRNSVSWHSMAHFYIFWPWTMVYFILEESPWKSLQDSSSRYWKSYFLFPQGPAKPRRVVFWISYYLRFVTPLMNFYGRERGSLRYTLCWQGIDNHWPF